MGALIPDAQKTRVIGLTGGIGTGKSEVSGILRELGASLVNADHIGHEAYKPNTSAWQEIVRAFGSEILQASGEIDRRRLGTIVFGDPKAKAKLDSIMYPRIGRAIGKKINYLRQLGGKVVVVEAALLIEAGWESLVDEVWVTHSPEQQVLDRLRRRNHLAEDKIQSRILSQLSFEERSRSADVLLENSGSMDELRNRVTSLWGNLVDEKVG